MKKLIASVLGLALIFTLSMSLVGCGGNKSSSSKGSTGTTETHKGTEK